MTRSLLYLIGEPGVGKSTLMAELLRGQPAYPQLAPVPHIVYGDGSLAQIGVERGAFSGTDGLAMSIQPRVEEWLRQRPYRTMLAEGDRLANGKFFNAVTAAGYELRVAWVSGSDQAAARRVARAKEIHFAPQDPAWVRGRQTKVNRLVCDFGAVVLPASETPAQLAERLADWGWHPCRSKVPA